MKVTLSQPQRILVAIIYLFILVVIFQFVGVGFGDLIWETSNDYSIWFYSGALLIVLGKYVAQPFFTKPTGSITNSMAVLISLLTLTEKDVFIGYNFALLYAVIVLLSSLISIALIKNEDETSKRVHHYTYLIATKFGDWSLIFSLIYLLAALSYFAFNDSPDLIALVLILTFWVCITFFDIIGKSVEFLSKLIKSTSTKYITEELGKAIGCENPKLYKIEIDNEKSVGIGDLITIQNDNQNKAVGLVINKNQLVDKIWIEVYLIEDKEGEIVTISTSHRSLFLDKKSIISLTNLAHKLEDIELLPKDIHSRIIESDLYQEKERFVGYVDEGSNVGKINFHMMNFHEDVVEGDILETKIYSEEVLFQVIDGFTKEEPLEKKDRYGYTIGIAGKLGNYDQKNRELKTVKWMPNMYSKLFQFKSVDITEEELKQIASQSIGRLPNTKFEIPISDYNTMITYNTAILGVLGIGKSCLTFELIQKIINSTGAKIICIDITNQYKVKLANYVNEDLIVDGLSAEALKNLKDNNRETGDPENPTTWGNEDMYKTKLDECIRDFGANKNKRILIFNPDWHNVSKAGKQFKIAHKVDLTVAEKSRLISERIFMDARKQGETVDARYLIVYEEAHALVPEWNSVASDGDKTATNGTAKVILQGRKYGLGSFVITQRTANVSKSILNQCNTMISLRIFDDTGKDFLTNYFGSEYSSTLSNLEERHAVITGRAFNLKQPVRLRLNEMKHVTIN